MHLLQSYYEGFFNTAKKYFDDWLNIQVSIENNISKQPSHGDFNLWFNTLKQLPEVCRTEILLDQDIVSVDINWSGSEKQKVKKQLLSLQPWRKGPFAIGDIVIDAEWQGHLKWNRIKDRIDLQNKKVLDVGSSNGYYGYRMLGAGADIVLGIDPTLIFVMQFLALNHFFDLNNITVAPIRMEDLPKNINVFDVVFSMGVLYHRKNPIEHLADLKSVLSDGGELILETIIIDDRFGDRLIINDRYAKMHNVYELPSIGLLQNWCEKAGFSNFEVLCVSDTTISEQRTTEWMVYDSLEQFLDSSDQSKTVEGYPAPVRAICKIKK